MGALFGGGGGGGVQVSQEAINEAAKRAEQSYFRPYTVTTSAGQAGYTPQGGYQTALSQPYQDILGTTLTGAGSMFEQAAAFDPTQRGQEIFAEQSALLQPEFQRQATDLQSRLFGSGRLGLRLAGESQGLGTGSGMVQPDALGLGRAQQQTLAGLSTQARNQALGEQAQLQQLAQNMLGSGMGISEMERALMAQGVGAETARAAAAYGAGSLAIQPYSDATRAAAQQQSNRTGLFGSLLGAALPMMMGPAGGLFASSAPSIGTVSGFNTVGPAAGAGSSGVFF